MNRLIRRSGVLSLLFVFAVLSGCRSVGITQDASGTRWLKGNLHTHSLWSDGNDFPEMVIDWYRQHGYDFIALSDHNILAQGEKWVAVTPGSAREEMLRKYVARFGDDRVVRRTSGDTTLVRLKTLEEYRPLFEEKDRFLILQSEEISDSYEKKPIHVNAHNVRELIRPQGGTSVRDVMQRDIDAVLEQSRRTGQPMLPHINHPNFGWAITVEDMMDLQGERFFEVYNGHPTVHNDGDTTRPGTDRMWDLILAHRLTHSQEIVYGLATDDAHNYDVYSPDRANPGRGWVMVRAASLTPEALIRAMEAGDFYATTGVELETVRADAHHLTLRINAEPGVTYTTRFIGTRRDFDRTSEPVTDAAGAPATRRYSNEIGVVLAEVKGTSASYTFKGDELYVRAVVSSSKKMDNAVVSGEVERAWVQPVVVGSVRNGSTHR